MDLLNIINQRIDLFLLILARVTGIFVLTPIFGSRYIPMPVKVVLAVLVSIIAAGVYPVPDVPDQSLLVYGITLLKEILVGLAIGFVIQLFFSTIQLAGQLIDMQMGFGVVNVIDPQYGIQVPLMGSFLYLLALLFFLSIDGHHMILLALFRSFELIPLGGAAFSGPLTELIFQITQGVFVTALKFSAPLLGSLFISDLVLGLLARAVPQMNIFLVGIPFKILVAFVMMALVVSPFIVLLNKLFEQGFHDLYRMFLIWAR